MAVLDAELCAAVQQEMAQSCLASVSADTVRGRRGATIPVSWEKIAVGLHGVRFRKGVVMPAMDLTEVIA
jgi:hypothetical protein